MIRFVKITFFLEFNSSFSYARRLPPAHLALKIHTIRFVGLS